MWQRIRQMLIKEFIQVFRDPRMRTVIFIIPCMQVLVTGYAVTTDVRRVPTAIADFDNSQLSRELIARFVNSGYFRVADVVHHPDELKQLIDQGWVMAAIQINDGFAADLRGGRTALVQVILDGTDSNSAGIVLGYAGKIVSAFSQQALTRRVERTLGGVERPELVSLRDRAWFNDNLDSRNFYVPGVIMIVVTLVTLLLTSMAVVREKEIGTMEQILVTPITPLEFILGKTVPFALIGMIDVAIVMLLGAFWFNVPFRGSVPLMLLGATLYLLTTLGIGLLISTISRTQQQAMMATFFFFFPAMLLSGFAVPISNMPPAIQWLTLLNPLRYFLVIVRSLFLKGVGLDILWPEYLALAFFGVLMIWLVAQRFHKTLS